MRWKDRLVQIRAGFEWQHLAFREQRLEQSSKRGKTGVLGESSVLGQRLAW